MSLRRMIEAWVCLLVLAAAGGACLFYEIWWPLYPVIGVLGAVLWLRRL